jgi:uncharacterized protein YjbK
VVVMHVDHVEREWKIIVDGPDAMERLVSWLGTPEREHRQRNIYFDTPDSDLRRMRRMLRVRVAGGTVVITFKSDSQIVDGFMSSREIEMELDAQTWSAVDRGERDLADLPHAPVVAALEGLSSPRLRAHGELQNLRRFYPRSAGYTLELDQTHYPDGTVDGEIEAEVISERAMVVRADLEAILQSVELPMTPQTQSKYARLLERGMDEG